MNLPRAPISAPSHARENRGVSHLVVALTMLAIGWAAPVTAASNSSSGGFEQLRQQDLRVANVAYRLAISNRKLCQEALKPQPGFILHGVEQYRPGDRERAASSSGLGRYMGVMTVVKGSQAEKAGLAPDDQLVSVNGRDLAAGAIPADARATSAFVERARQIVLDEMNKGEVTLRIANAAGYRDLRFGTDAGCPFDVVVVPSTTVNAWADGARVVVTSAIVEQCDTDDDLALVIAHELAHNILRHRQRLALAGVPDNRLLPVSAAGSAKIRATEEEADRFAVSMASAAGYDLSRAASFLNRLLEANGLSRRAAATHPGSVRRLSLLSAAIAKVGRESGRTAPYSRPARAGRGKTAPAGLVSGKM